MYQIVLGKVSTLSTAPLPPGLHKQAPQGPQHKHWLAGHALLSHTLSPLPEIIYGKQGKPAFAPEMPLWFNLSHSSDNITLLLSDEGKVSCNIKVIHPRTNWHWLANTIFSLREHTEMDTMHPDQQLEMFWHIWTRKEAIIKQHGSSTWQIISIDSTYHSSLSVSHCQLENLSLAICTPTPFTLTTNSVPWINSVN